MIFSTPQMLLPAVLLAPAVHAITIPRALQAAAPKTCSSPALSCSGTSSDTCCFNTPGGQLVQTQFWDTNPVTGMDTLTKCTFRIPRPRSTISFAKSYLLTQAKNTRSIQFMDNSRP